MTTTLRLHSVTSTAAVPDLGTESCDFRGAHFIGDAQGDQHHTLFELDVEDDDPRVAAMLEFGPSANKALSLLEGEFIAGVHTTDMIPFLRVGVWDKTAPAS